MFSPIISEIDLMLDITLKTFSECDSWIRTCHEDYYEIKLDTKTMEALFDYDEDPNQQQKRKPYQCHNNTNFKRWKHKAYSNYFQYILPTFYVIIFAPFVTY